MAWLTIPETIPNERTRAAKAKHRELAIYLLVIIKIRLNGVKRMSKIQNTP